MDIDKKQIKRFDETGFAGSRASFSSVPQRLQSAIKNQFLVNLQTLGVTESASDSQIEQAMNSAIADSINSEDLGNYGWSRFAPTTTEYFKGDLVLTQDAVENHFSILDPDKADGKSSDWIDSAATKLLENQLSKSGKKHKGKYIWGDNVYLQPSGKVNSDTGKPIYNVRVRRDKQFGNILYDDKSQKIEIDLSPAFQEQETAGIAKQLAERIASEKRFANRATSYQKDEKRVEKNLKERDTSRAPRDKKSNVFKRPETGVF